MLEDSNTYKNTSKEELIQRIEVLQQHIISIRKTNSQLYFNTLIDEMPLAYQSLDEYGRIIRVNTSWLHLMEYEEKEVLGTQITNFFTKKSIALFQRKFPVYKKRGVLNNSEMEFISKSGNIIICEVYGTIEYNSNGEMRVSHCLLLNVSERKKIEQENIETKKNWQFIFQAISSPTLIISSDFTIEYANEAALAVTNLPINKIVGKDYCSVLYPQQNNNPKNCTSIKWLKDLKSAHIQEEFIDGYNSIFLISATPIFDNHGALDKIIHIATDISEIKKISDKLIESEEKYKDLANLLPQPVFECNKEGLLTFVNKYGLEMFGYTEEDKENGIHIHQIFHNSQLDLLSENIHNLYKTGTNSGNEYHAQHKNGETFPIIIYSNVIYENSEIAGIRGIVLNLTNQKQAEAKIIENQRVLQSLLSNLPGFLFRCKNTLAREMLYVSQQVKDITGYIKDDYVQQTIYYGNIIAQEHTHRVWEAWQAAIEKKEPIKIEYQIVHKSGERRWVHESAFPFYDAQGTLLFIEGYISDITEQKHTELVLRHSIDAITQPIKPNKNITIEDLFDIKELQKIQDNVAETLGISSIITSPHGQAITKPSHFCSLCKQLRASNNTHIQCNKDVFDFENFTATKSHIKLCTVLNLPYYSTKIEVGGTHVANWLIGQIIFDKKDKKNIEEKAQSIGLSTEEATALCNELPIIDKEKFEEIRATIDSVVNNLSKRAYEVVEQSQHISLMQKKEVDTLKKSIDIELQNKKLHETYSALQVAMESMSKSEKKYRLLFSEVQQAIAIFNAVYSNGEIIDFTFIDINASYENVFGFKQKNIQNKRLLQIVPHFNRQTFEHFKTSVRTGEFIRFEEEIPHINKFFEVLVYSPQENQCAVIINDVSKQKAILNLLTDKNHEIEAQNEEYQQLNEELSEANSNLQKAHAQIKQSEEKFRLLFSEMSQGIALHQAIVNDEGEMTDYIFLDVNPAYEDITGLKREAILGKRVREVLPDVEEYWIKTFGEVVKTGKTVRFENQAKELGKHFETLIYRPQAGQFAAIVTDISIRKNTERTLVEKTQEIEAQNEELLQANTELKVAKQKAEESDRLKSSFLANLSHEIRTPMNAILGFSELLLDHDITPAQQKEFVGIIQKSGSHLLTIINDLIDVSKIETGQIVPQLSKFYIAPFMRDVYSTLQVLIESDKQIDFSLTIDTIDEDTTIYTDEVKLRQILINLVTNAIKFTEKGFVSIQANITDSDFVCTVADSGSGIAKEYYSVIFDRFRQIEGDEAIKKGGSGLGLAISKAYIDMLHGTISLESKIGEGTTFTFTIPHSPNEKKKHKIKHKTTATPRQQAAHQQEQILIAEDDDINYYYLTKILDKAPYKLLRAINGEDAVTIVKNNPEIKLVLMDIKMPIMNGYEATKIIKEFRPELPIIAQTAYALSDDLMRINQSNFSDYISKPTKKDELLKLIEKYL